MRDFQHIDHTVDRIVDHTVDPIESIASSPRSVGRVESNPLFGRVSMVGSRWTCIRTSAGATVNTAAKPEANTAEGDSNTEDEVASA